MKARLSRLLRRLRSRRVLAWMGAAMLSVVAALSLHLGWFSKAQPWESATGWDQIPQEDRPTLSVAWESAEPGREPPTISWLGHAGFLLEWKGVRLLLDPNVSSWCTLTCRVLEPAPLPRELGAIDAVLLSHAHFDHLDLPTLRGLRSLDTLVVPSGAERYFDGAEWDQTQVRSLDPGDCLALGPLEFCAVEAQHNGNRWHPFESRVEALGYVIRSTEDAIFFAGDTGAGMDLAGVAARFRPRAAILPIGAYLPRFPMKHYHLSPAEAVEAGELLGVETVVPCHFGTFAVSLDRPAWALPLFAQAASEAGLSWMMPPLLKREAER
jgi:L-ascorbate metabolism protein UlaG (beta-lactamase superfamily)